MIFFLEGTESGKISSNQREGQMAKVKHKLDVDLYGTRKGDHGCIV